MRILMKQKALATKKMVCIKWFHAGFLLTLYRYKI